MNPPIYLSTKGKIKADIEFDEEEVIYRRFPIKQQRKFANDYFSATPTKDFEHGISVNRSRYSKNPFDVLWSIFKTESDDCNYELKDGEVIYCKISNLNNFPKEYGVEIYCVHTPFCCNISHCDLKCNPEFQLQEKKVKVDIRLFLNTVFYPVENI